MGFSLLIILDSNRHIEAYAETFKLRSRAMDKKMIDLYRYFLKDSVRLTIDFYQTEQNRGVAPPPIEKPVLADSSIINLPSEKERHAIPSIDLISAMKNRKSHRTFRKAPLTREELSFLLWATQGVRKKVDETTAYRTVPSAGCRHTFETYLCVLNVSGLETGLYRYLPLEHGLVVESHDENIRERIVEAALGQPFFGKAAVTFIWTTLPYRMEWRYDIAAHKVIAIDAGHVCQNLYLACEAINAGTCAVAAYNQTLMDELVNADGDDEFVVYMAPVGKIK
jgi:SagB-type dehydrogenase family enzyme